MIYGYARVSTKGQERDGNSLEAQEQVLRESGAQVIYTDSYTGTKLCRPELDKLMSKLTEGDTIIVTKFDRIARSVLHGSELITDLINKGVRVHVLNIGIIDNTPTGKLIRTVLLAFAEFERDMIVERTQEGKAIAKQSPDYREGRPRIYGRAQIDHALTLLATNSYKQVEELTGISKSTLIRAKRERQPKHGE